MVIFTFLNYYTKKLCFFSMVLLFICFFCPQAYGQIDTVYKLKDVRIKAINIAPARSISPLQQINTVDFKRISAYNVADAIRNFSGVNIKDYGGIGGLKTVSVRSLGANHTGVLLDGAPISDSQNGQVDLGKINLDNVQSISLFNGQPGDIAVSAKSLSSGSVLIIKQLEPYFEKNKKYNLSLGLKTGSFGLINPSLQWQQKISDKWSLNYSSFYQKANGKYKYKVEGDGSDTLATRTNAAIEVLQTDLGLAWTKNDSTRISFRANYYHSDRGLPGAVVFYNPYTNQHLWNRDLFLQSNYQQKWERLRLVSVIKYAKNYLRYLDPDYLNIAGQLDQRYHQQEFYGSGTVAYRFLPQLEVAYASDITYNTLATNLYSYAYPNRYTYLNALSAAIKLKKLQLQGTLLHTFIRETVAVGDAAANKSIFLPTILASFKPFGSENILGRVFYKKIFRAPTFNDLYYTRMGNRNLKPEYATQYNVGLTYQYTSLSKISFITATVDAYYNKVDDKIIAIPNKDLFTWTMLNLGEVDIRGLDVSLKAGFKLIDDVGFTFSGNYTFQKALDVTDKNSSTYLNQIPYTPEHTFALNLGFNYLDWGLFYNHIYSSHRYYLTENLPEYHVPGFSVSDLSLSKNFKVQNNLLSTSVEINNLFNQSYAFIRSFPMPGRSLRIAIQLKI